MEPIRWFMLCFFSITSKSLASCFSSAPGSHIYLSSSLPLISEFIRHTSRMEGENFMTHFVCHSTFPSAVSNRLFQPNDLSCLEVVWLKTLAYTHILKYRPLSSDWLVMPVWHSLFVVRYLACWGDNYVCLLLTTSPVPFIYLQGSIDIPRLSAASVSSCSFFFSARSQQIVFSPLDGWYFEELKTWQSNQYLLSATECPGVCFLFVHSILLQDRVLAECYASKSGATWAEVIFRLKLSRISFSFFLFFFLLFP